MLGPEIPVDQPGASPAEVSPAAAFNGSNYFVVWNGHGTRLDATGVVLDQSPIAVGTGNYPAAVASTPSGWLVVGNQPNYYGAALVASTGTLVASNINLVSGANGARTGLTGAATAGAIGSNYLVFWMDPTSMDPEVLWASHVSGDGTTVTDAQQTQYNADLNPATACAADRCLVAFMAATRIDPISDTPANVGYFFVNDALHAGTRFTITASAGQQAFVPQVAYDGANWLIVWEEISGTRANLRAIRIGPTGARIDAAPFAVGTYQSSSLTAYAPLLVGTVAVSFDGAEFVAAWDTHPGISVARISSAGVVLDPGGVTLTGPAGSTPALAGPLLAYSRPVTGGTQVFARLIAVPPGPDGGVDAASPTDGGHADSRTNVDAASSADGGHADAAADAGPEVDAASSADGGHVDAAADAGPEVDAASSADGGHVDAAADARTKVDAAADVTRRSDAAIDASRMDASRDTHPAVDAAADHPRLADAAADATRTDAGTHPNVDAATDHARRSDAAASTDAPADASGGDTASGCSCGVAAPPESGGISLVLLAAVGLLLARRRRASLAPVRNLPTTRR